MYLRIVSNDLGVHQAVEQHLQPIVDVIAPFVWWVEVNGQGKAHRGAIAEYEALWGYSRLNSHPHLVVENLGFVCVDSFLVELAGFGLNNAANLLVVVHTGWPR